MDKPRVFISSTIYDFKDLRSALKYWFNELGYDVQLSEHSDFGKDSAHNSYDACLEVISTCDYFILLVGSRRGGMYDENISVTRKEYQIAYELAQAGKIKKIITFVRQSIWDVLEDRQGLQQLLAEQELFEQDMPFDTSKILYYDSKLIKHAEHIQSFINEVKRKDDFHEDNKPKFNWINTFNDFADIINVIKIELKISSNISRKILYENIRYALASNLKELTHKTENGKIGAYFLGFKAIKEKYYKLDGNANNVNANILVTKDEIGDAAYFMLLLRSSVKPLTTYIFEECLSSGLLLDYDKQNETFIDTQLSKALRDMIYEIKMLKRYETEFSIEEEIRIMLQLQKFNKSNEYIYNFSFYDLSQFLSIYECMNNIYELTLYMFDLLGDKLDSRAIYPNLQHGIVKSNKPTLEDILNFFA